MCTKHEIRGPRDISAGECRKCVYERQAARRQRQKLGLELIKQMIAAGLRESDLKENSGFAIGLAWAAAADEHELAEIERQHPAMVGKLRRMLDRIEAGR